MFHRSIVSLWAELCAQQQHQQQQRQWQQLPGGGARAFSSSSAAASTPPPLPQAVVDAIPPLLGPGCDALAALQATTGLPWWAAIPLATLSLKAALLPLSVRQARIVRSNMALWAESHELSRQHEAQLEAAARQHVQQQQQTQQQQGGAGHSTAAEAGAGAAPAPTANAAAAAAPPPAAATAAPGVPDGLLQLLRWRRRVELYGRLRRKCGVPHPAWFLANNLVQWPAFVYVGMAVRAMAQSAPPWPGLDAGGALWFTDLTLPAVLPPTAAAAAAAGGSSAGMAAAAAAAAAAGGGGWALPMGAPGLGLPLLVTCAMLASIRLGFKASGAASRHPSIAGTPLQPLLRHLPTMLYGMTLASLYLKLQLPQAVLLHWLAASGFTLGLQLALRNPRARAALGYGGPAAAAALAGAGGANAGAGAGAGAVDAALEARVAAAGGADVLVAMAAREAALHRYGAALFCLERAVALDPSNAG